jgi:hypothetical protein
VKLVAMNTKNTASKNTNQKKGKGMKVMKKKEMHYKCKWEWNICKMGTKLTHVRT